MPDPIEERIAALSNLSKVALCDIWKQTFNTPPPARLRRNLIIPILGHRIQERAFRSKTCATGSRNN